MHFLYVVTIFQILELESMKTFTALFFTVPIRQFNLQTQRTPSMKETPMLKIIMFHYGSKLVLVSIKYIDLSSFYSYYTQLNVEHFDSDDFCNKNSNVLTS